MEAFFSTVKNKVGEWYESHGEAKGQLFDYIECSITSGAATRQQVG